MDCADVGARLDAYLDGELDVRETSAVAAHLARCPACTASLDRLRALGEALRAELPPHAVPDLLRARVRDAVRDAAPAAGPVRVVPWRGLGIAAAMVVCVAAGWAVASWRGARGSIADAVLAAHVRSLMPGHLTDVASTDQHTVKPWFDGRLDFSPPVTDEAPAGFPLLGGRLDYLGGRTAAALVYGRRLHRINLFVWPDRGARDGEGSARAERDGYHLEHWTQGGMVFWAVSDLSVDELEQFVRLLRGGAGSAPPASPAGGGS